MKQRIRQIFPHNGAVHPDPGVPRGWITPQGHFLETKEHWASINSHFRRLEIRAATQDVASDDAAEAERTAHLAYGLGWISVGHAGKLNAIGHQRTFKSIAHPALLTLRKLLSETPAFTIQIELQIGAFVPAKGMHEDFELKEYDLDGLIKRGRLRQSRV